MIENMNKAETRHKMMNTHQTCHNGNVVPHKNEPTAVSMLPIAVATNQPPIIIPLYWGGATFETNDIPIGESSSSPNVSTK